jgi:hypothetical protein
MPEGPEENQTKATNVPTGTRSFTENKSELHRFVELADPFLRYYMSIFVPFEGKS